MNVRGTPTDRRTTGRVRSLTAIVAALALTTAACEAGEDDATDDPPGDDAVDAAAAIEFRHEAGPRVEVPDRAMAMTVDAVATHGDDILVRIRVENVDDDYLDMGVEDTIYGPLLVMHDDRGNRYDSYAVEPAGVPGRRVADVSFRLVGPLDPDAETFTLELTTQRGPLTSPPGDLPDGDGVRWQVADPTGSEPSFAAAPRLPT